MPAIYIGEIKKAVYKSVRKYHRSPENVLTTVLLHPPGWDASPSQGYPQKYVAGTHLYTWVESTCLRKKHDARVWAWNHRPSYLRSNALTTTPQIPHVCCVKQSVNVNTLQDLNVPSPRYQRFLSCAFAEADKRAVHRCKHEAPLRKYETLLKFARADGSKTRLCHYLCFPITSFF